MAVAPAAAPARNEVVGLVSTPFRAGWPEQHRQPRRGHNNGETSQQDWVHGLKVEPAEPSGVQLEQPEGINVVLQQQAVQRAGFSNGFVAPDGWLFWRLSLLAQLLVEFPFISARHPASLVLVNAAATDFSCPLLGFRFGSVEPFAVGHSWRLVHQQGQNAEAESR